MRLLNINTFDFEEFDDANTCPPYVIASHRWIGKTEATYKDVLKKRNVHKDGYKKVDKFCSFIRRTDPSVEWLWIDTCCINKSSSAELTESINSMFEWYKNAKYCLAYLADVRALANGPATVISDFEHSVWFTRGWTLQELLAPKVVLFLTKEWEVLGLKGSVVSFPTQIWDHLARGLNRSVANVTGIPETVLLDFDASKKLSIEQRMQWVYKRRTTRSEDMAYCLLGIFDISMPLVYGEGRKARTRLSKEIKEWQNGSEQRRLATVEPPLLARLKSAVFSRGGKRHNAKTTIDTSLERPRIYLHYKCSYCGLRFGQEHDRNSHIDILHGREALDEGGSGYDICSQTGLSSDSAIKALVQSFADSECATCSLPSDAPLTTSTKDPSLADAAHIDTPRESSTSSDVEISSHYDVEIGSRDECDNDTGLDLPEWLTSQRLEWTKEAPGSRSPSPVPSMTSSASSYSSISSRSLSRASSIMEYEVSCLQEDDNGVLELHQQQSDWKCPFYFLGCNVRLTSTLELDLHCRSHFAGFLPLTARCPFECGWFCTGPTGDAAWRQRSLHVSLYHQHSKVNSALREPDLSLLKHLSDTGVIDKRQETEIRVTGSLMTDMPPIYDLSTDGWKIDEAIRDARITPQRVAIPALGADYTFVEDD